MTVKEQAHLIGERLREAHNDPTLLRMNLWDYLGWIALMTVKEVERAEGASERDRERDQGRE